MLHVLFLTEGAGYLDSDGEDGKSVPYEAKKKSTPNKGHFGKRSDVTPERKPEWYKDKMTSYNRERTVNFIGNPVESGLHDTLDSRDSSGGSGDENEIWLDSDTKKTWVSEDEFQEDYNIGVNAPDTPIVKDNSLMDADIPPDRNDQGVRALYMVGKDGETRPRGLYVLHHFWQLP